MPFCPSCGYDVDEDDEFCSKCRQSLKEGARTQRISYRRVSRSRREKDEKDEKDEKREGDKKGDVVGGLIVVWLGVSFVLRNAGIISWGDFGGVFLMGIGTILILRGIYAYSQSRVFDHGFGYIVGGSFLTMIGAGIVWNFDDLWAIFIVALGLVIVFRAITDRGKNPRP